MNGIEKLFLELDDKEAMALAQFIKRLTWTEMRACAISEALLMEWSPPISCATVGR
ncbi:hypothetical protein NLX98_26880 (plasmid) [Klebsiella quasipneumoniae]|uniref:DUF7706 family protein n=1 Tax=Klebsiella quasipneumoniae TaxID=1463165 RepID=UPI00287456D1|nr:hypothetical protein [Klebsiella quasipneumoniae]MDS0275665.1 hypothetical protein [Klebsiella quasipneumoniae]